MRSKILSKATGLGSSSLSTLSAGRRVDELAYNLYGLTEEEIGIVEGM
jgi:hypothetical protein